MSSPRARSHAPDHAHAHAHAHAQAHAPDHAQAHAQAHAPDHAHAHAADHAPDHAATPTRAPKTGPDTDALLLDVGADLGALVVHAPAELAGQEVEIVAAGRPGHRPVHNVVRPRRVAGGVVFAAVFPDLAPGDYLPYGGWVASGRLGVAAGAVAEATWAPPAAPGTPRR